MNNKVRIAFLFALVGLIVGYMLYAKIDADYITIKELFQNDTYAAIKKKVISTGGIGALLGFGISVLVLKKKK